MQSPPFSTLRLRSRLRSRLLNRLPYSSGHSEILTCPSASRSQSERAHCDRRCTSLASCASSCLFCAQTKRFHKTLAVGQTKKTHHSKEKKQLAKRFRNY